MLIERGALCGRESLLTLVRINIHYTKDILSNHPIANHLLLIKKKAKSFHSTKLGSGNTCSHQFQENIHPILLPHFIFKQYVVSLSNLQSSLQISWKVVQCTCNKMNKTRDNEWKWSRPHTHLSVVSPYQSIHNFEIKKKQNIMVY